MYTALEYLEKYVGTATLCGSTRFFFEAMEANRRLTFMEWIVLMCGSWGHSYHKYDESYKERDYTKVKKLHFHKIQMSQIIVVVTDKNSYIGDSTKAEIAFAEYLNKPVFWFDGEFSATSNFDGQLIQLDEKTENIRDTSIIRDTSLIDKFERHHKWLGF